VALKAGLAQRRQISLPGRLTNPTASQLAGPAAPAVIQHTCSGACEASSPTVSILLRVLTPQVQAARRLSPCQAGAGRAPPCWLSGLQSKARLFKPVEDLQVLLLVVSWESCFSTYCKAEAQWQAGSTPTGPERQDSRLHTWLSTRTAPPQQLTAISRRDPDPGPCRFCGRSGAGATHLGPGLPPVLPAPRPRP